MDSGALQQQEWWWEEETSSMQHIRSPSNLFYLHAAQKHARRWKWPYSLWNEMVSCSRLTGLGEALWASLPKDLQPHGHGGKERNAYFWLLPTTNKQINLVFDQLISICFLERVSWTTSIYIRNTSHNIHAEQLSTPHKFSYFLLFFLLQSLIQIFIR